jgi:hypothetical protein
MYNFDNPADVTAAMAEGNDQIGYLKADNGKYELAFTGELSGEPTLFAVSSMWAEPEAARWQFDTPEAATAAGPEFRAFLTQTDA